MRTGDGLKFDPETLISYQSYLASILAFRKALGTFPGLVEELDLARQANHMALLQKCGCLHPDNSHVHCGVRTHEPCLKFLLAEQVESDLQENG